MLGVDIMTQGGSVGNDNIVVGRSAVDANVCRTTGFSRNIIVGHYAAYCAASSGCNVIIGNQAGYNITSGCSFFLSSITSLNPSRSDSSLRWLIPKIFLSLTSIAIDSISLALFTWYGSSFITIELLSLFSSIS